MSAIDTFRRAMRRHERRARRIGAWDVAGRMRVARTSPREASADLWSNEASHALAGMGQDPHHRTVGFLCKRVADTVARLREGLRREQEAEEDYPYVCPDCYCVGEQPHAPGCWEEERERRAEYGSESDDDALDPSDVECPHCGFPTFDCKCDDDYGDDDA